MDAIRPRPHVICHMVATLDGRIVTSHWPELGEGLREYERTAATIASDGWMCGRVTMAHFAGATRDEAEVAREPVARAAGAPLRADSVAPGARAPYAVALDPRGRLAWSRSAIDGDHVVAVLGEGVPDSHLDRLRGAGVSYLFAGPGDDLDLARALETLAATFGIRTLLLEGGGRINGSLLQAGLVDEISLLLVPATDGALGTPSVFDVEARFPGHVGRTLRLESFERRSADVMWLRYRVERAAG
jgi:2,5-diamino-6-(ribosylamino)-4(3H)-pyrimidinone 5'-phosphate reductase